MNKQHTRILAKITQNWPLTYGVLVVAISAITFVQYASSASDIGIPADESGSIFSGYPFRQGVAEAGTVALYMTGLYWLVKLIRRLRKRKLTVLQRTHHSVGYTLAYITGFFVAAQLLHQIMELRCKMMDVYEQCSVDGFFLFNVLLIVVICTPFLYVLFWFIWRRYSAVK